MNKEISFMIVTPRDGTSPFATFPNNPPENRKLRSELHSNLKFGFSPEQAERIYQEARKHYSKRYGIPLEEMTP